jgi:hypothetical protein
MQTQRKNTNDTDTVQDRDMRQPFAFGHRRRSGYDTIHPRNYNRLCEGILWADACDVSTGDAFRSAIYGRGRVRWMR